MARKSKQLRENSADIGSSTLGFAKVQKRFNSGNIKQKVAALSKAQQYGQNGLELIIQALKDESWQVQGEAFMLLRDKARLPHVNQALQEYIALDSEYPEDPGHLFLPDVEWSSEEEEEEYHLPVPASKLLQLMKWGELIQLDDYRFSQVYIIDSDEQGKRWRHLPSDDAGYGSTIPLKFLQKKGYTYYLNAHLDIKSLPLPLFNGKEVIIFEQRTICKQSWDYFYKIFAEVDEPFLAQEVLGQEYSIPFTRYDDGLLIEKEGRWFLVTEEGSETSLLRLENFYLIPKNYLSLRGYQYYRQISLANNLPLIGYLSPKEYLDFLHFLILDWSLFSDYTPLPM